MFQNYVKIAWRNIIRNKRTSLINLVGLSLGIASALILFTIVQFERGYDNFHKNHKEVYRIVTDTEYGNSTGHNEGVPYPVAKALAVDLPQLEAIVPLHATGGQVNVLASSQKNIVDKYSELMLFTTSDFFTLFDAEWLAGDAGVLSKPDQVILDRETATRFFGSWQQAMGQRIQLENEVTVEVAAVVENARQNSNFPYRILISFPTLEANNMLFYYNPDDWNTLSSNFQTYVLLNPEDDVQAISQQLDVLNKQYFEGRGSSKRIMRLQPLGDIHFDLRYGTIDGSGNQLNRSTLTTLSLIGLFILMMASINFVNLSTVQAIGKSKEIGVRKVLGSNKRDLIALSLSETFVLVLGSLVVAVALAYLALPHIHHFSNMPENPKLWQGHNGVFLLVALVAVTLLSGIYPALVIAGFKPVVALKNKVNTSSIGGLSLRKVLVVTQFAIAQLLMVGTLVAVRQMSFIRDADLGFDKESVYYIHMPNDDGVRQRMQVFKQQLLQIPDVKSVSLASDMPSSANKSASNFYFNGDASDNITFPAFLKFADADYFDNYGLSLVAGRPYVESDTLREAVINETMAQKLGLPAAEEAIGKSIRIGTGPWMMIAGVVQDFTPNSLHEEVSPIIMATNAVRYYTAGIKLDKGFGKNTLATIQQRFEELYPEHYYEGNFLDESIARFYEREEKMANVYQLFAVLALIISGIGLYGMVSFMIGQKVKEIGIRKVLGASIGSIVYLFSKEFIYMVIVAFCVAAPIAYYFMHDWLSNFAYHIDLGIGLFLFVMVASLVIAMLTIGVKSLRAAMANPVESLRDE